MDNNEESCIRAHRPNPGTALRASYTAISERLLARTWCEATTTRRTGVLRDAVLSWGHDEGVVEDTDSGTGLCAGDWSLQWGHDEGVVEGNRKCSLLHRGHDEAVREEDRLLPTAVDRLVRSQPLDASLTTCANGNDGDALTALPAVVDHRAYTAGNGSRNARPGLGPRHGRGIRRTRSVRHVSFRAGAFEQHQSPAVSDTQEGSGGCQDARRRPRS